MQEASGRKETKNKRSLCYKAIGFLDIGDQLSRTQEQRDNSKTSRKSRVKFSKLNNDLTEFSF